MLGRRCGRGCAPQTVADTCSTDVSGYRLRRTDGMVEADVPARFVPPFGRELPSLRRTTLSTREECTSHLLPAIAKFGAPTWGEVCRRARARLQTPRSAAPEAVLSRCASATGKTGSKEAPVQVAVASADVGGVGRASVLELRRPALGRAATARKARSVRLC